MITFTVFPRLRQNPNEKNNPYIENFIASLTVKEKVLLSILHTETRFLAYCLPNDGET